MFGDKNTGEAGDKFAKMDNAVCYSTRAEAIAEVERECNVRFKCFDRWVKDGKLGEVEARDRLQRLISAWHFLSDTDEAREQLATEETST